MDGILKDKVALVTGGSRGIGRAIALRLARDGALVCVHYGANRDGADATVKEISTNGGKAFVVGADLRDAAAIKEMFATLDQELAKRGSNGIDILVNNAGIGGGGSIKTVSADALSNLVDTNIKGLFFVTQHAIPRLRNDGRVINISSMVSLAAYPGSIAYAMTKAAVNSFSRSLALELAPRGITVNAVAPGATDTDFLSKLTPEYRQIVIDGTAMKRMGRPEDIAGMIAFLAGPESGWVTGQVIAVSGGMHL